MSENSIEFSLSNSEQRDSWLNSGYWTLDADRSDMWESQMKRSTQDFVNTSKYQNMYK